MAPVPKKQNLVVRYHGTSKRKPILLLAHIDVVEAKREDWSLDPFMLTEKDGYFYGRDERIPVQSFYEGQFFLYPLVKSLSSPQN
jgi:hypothetical protein